MHYRPTVLEFRRRIIGSRDTGTRLTYDAHWKGRCIAHLEPLPDGRWAAETDAGEHLVFRDMAQAQAELVFFCLVGT